jgi:methionine biosynthesis protein MetW
MRVDHQTIQTWIRPNTRVLDLGCGDGTLLRQLTDELNIHGYGIEINQENILRCVEINVNVIEQNLDEGLSNFDDQSFDTVIMSQTIQTMHNPDKVLSEMLRVGRQCVVTFPNFAHWRARLHLALKGRMPVSEHLPYEWYNTPNIHFCTIKDFEVLCKNMGIHILNRVVLNHESQSPLIELKPNFFAETALYSLSKK